MWYVKTYRDEAGRKLSGMRAAADNGLNDVGVRQYLNIRFTVSPETIIKGVTKTTDFQVPELSPERPLEELLQAQKPTGRRAVLLSGGVDSSVIAKLYDDGDTDFVFVQTLIGKERNYFDMVAATLKGRKHIVTLTPELYYKYACEIYERIQEPVGDAAIISVYAGAKLVNALGIQSLVVGEGGDETFGGYWLYPFFRPDNKDDTRVPMTLPLAHACLGFGEIPKPLSEYWSGFQGNCLEHVMDWDRNVALRDLFLWKNVWGASLAGVDCYVPFAHPTVGVWAKRFLKPSDLVDNTHPMKTKIWLKNLALSLGVPPQAVNRLKMGFASEMDEKVFKWMRDDTGFDNNTHVKMFPIWSLKRWCMSVGLPFNWRDYVMTGQPVG